MTKLGSSGGWDFMEVKWQRECEATVFLLFQFVISKNESVGTPDFRREGGGLDTSSLLAVYFSFLLLMHGGKTIAWKIAETFFFYQKPASAC